MTKTGLSKEQMICDLYGMSFAHGEWCRYLIMERNFTVEEVLEAMQRMVDYIQNK